MAKKHNTTVDIVLSIIIIIMISSLLFYVWNIINNPYQSNEGYTATITLVWRNIPKELASNIRINDPIFIGNKPEYIVVNKWITPYLKAIPTATSATIVKSKDTYNVYLKIRNLYPLSSTTPPVGKSIAILGNTISIESYIWQFDGIVVQVETATYSLPKQHYLEPPQTLGCNYKIIARNIYPSVLDHINTGEALYDILDNQVMILKNIEIKHPFLYGWGKKGVVIVENPLQTDVILTVSPLKGQIPIEINGKPAKVGRALEIRGKDWRIWGRIIEVTCP